MKRLAASLLSAFLFVASLLSSCAFNKPDGDVYSPVQLSTPSKALVYFYRPYGESRGYDRTYFLHVNQRTVTNLLHGGYFPFETSPGKLSIVSDVNKSWGQMVMLDAALIEAAINAPSGKLSLQVEAGKTYYVRMHPEPGFFHFSPQLTLLSKEAAETANL